MSRRPWMGFGSAGGARRGGASIAFFFDWDWARADREWNLALQARGGDVDPTYLMAYALQQWALGRLDAARDLAHRARMMDPLSPAFVAREADFLLQAGRLEEAASLYEKAIQRRPDDPRVYFGLGGRPLPQGRLDDAIEARRRGHLLQGDDGLRELLSAARGAEGYRQIEHATARLQIASLDARAASGGYVSPLDYARSWAMLGDRGLALRVPRGRVRGPRAGPRVSERRSRLGCHTRPAHVPRRGAPRRAALTGHGPVML